MGGVSTSPLSGDKTEDRIGGNDMWVMQLTNTLAVADTELTAALSVYPNPVAAQLNVSLQASPIENISLYDLQGHLIRVFDDINSTTTHQINVSDLASGIYFIQVTSEGKTAARKFIKN